MIHKNTKKLLKQKNSIEIPSSPKVKSKFNRFTFVLYVIIL